MKKRTESVFERVADKSYRGFARVSTQDDALDVLTKKDSLVIVERGKPRSLKMRCPCDANHILTINLDNEIGMAWRLRIGDSAVSLFPSVWLETGCRCHFILRNNRVYVLGRRPKVKRRKSKNRVVDWGNSTDF
jgi:hypothetical protein